MIRKFLLTILFINCLPLFAGEYEDAIKTHDKVFLYVHAQKCNYCKIFEPIYEKLMTNYNKECKFVKVDSGTNYGNNLASKFRIKFVPYVVLVKSKENRGIVINPKCLLEYECSEKILVEFLK